MSIKTINGFIDWTKKSKGPFILYRGLSDARMALEASGYRRIKTKEKPFPSMRLFHSYITELLERANLQGFRQKQGNNLSDLELLAELQHNGAATCLIDFTRNPLIALWFACQENLEKNGKVAVMKTDNIDAFDAVNYERLSKPIKELFEKEKLWKWVPAPQNNRIVAQNSVFVFGKGRIANRYYETIEIQKESKESIIRELRERFGVDEEYLFSDFSGFALANAHNKLYRSSAEDYFYLGVGASQRAEHKKAIKYYSKAIELNPQYAEAYNNRGIAKNHLDDHLSALADYDKAIEFNPRSAEAYNNRGNAKRALNDYRGAICRL